MNIGTVIVGDEILSGKRADKHMPKVIELLSARGLQLDWAEYVGDSPERITATLARAFLARLASAPMGQRSANESDVREALIAAHDAKRLLDQTGGVEEGEALVRVVYAEALAHAGDQDAARAAIKEARDRLHVRASWLHDATLRDSFLTRVPENARTLELARMWLE